jgi:endonuclease YncB( thermonuclease family)
MTRRRSVFLSSLLILIVSGVLLYLLKGVPQKDLTGVAQAIDGDSLRLGNEELRLKGIDAPELLQICTISGKETPCGREARAALRKLLSSGLVTCIGDGLDRYGRLLAYCRVRGIDINAAMVRDGQAIAFGDYNREESEAKAAYRGIWAGTFERPQDWRKRNSDRQ